MRNLLSNLLTECPKCSTHFYSNVGTIVDDGDMLSDAQVEAVLVHLLGLHDVH